MSEKKRHIFRNTGIIVCAVFLFLIIAYDIYLSTGKYEDTYLAMGTVITADIRGRNSEKASKEIREEISALEESVLSWRVEDSDVGRINANSGKDVSIPGELAYYIQQSIDLSEKCGGAFDITLGKLTQLWNIGSGNEKVPSESEIKAALETVGADSILINDNSVRINNRQQLDLGAVGKGIACEYAKNILDTYSIKSATVSVGGSVLIYGKAASVGIVNPKDDSKYFATLKLKDKYVSTSGSYERYFEADGKKYHHILDPSTGYPAENDLLSVTVVCGSGFLSDALSTACFVMGYKSSLGILSQYNAEAVYVFSDGTYAVTDGLSDVFTLTDSSFKVKK